MNCRRVNSLLSAYIDGELTGAEMFAIRDHLRDCAGCQNEQETLHETKRLVASLAFRAPRAELEALLLHEANRASVSPWGGVAALVMSWLGSGTTSPVAVAPLYLRPRPLAATALLSLAGFWLASASLDSPGDVGALRLGRTPGSFEPTAAAMSPLMGTGRPSVEDTPARPLMMVAWSGNTSAPVSYASYSGGGGLTPTAVAFSPSSVPLQASWGGGASIVRGAAALLSSARRFSSH